MTCNTPAGSNETAVYCNCNRLARPEIGSCGIGLFEMRHRPCQGQRGISDKQPGAERSVRRAGECGEMSCPIRRIRAGRRTAPVEPEPQAGLPTG